MAHKQKVSSRAPAGDLLLMLAMRGLEQGDAPHCARRRVSEANRRVAAALRPEMCRNQQSSGLLVSQRVLYFSRTVCYGITVHGLPTIFMAIPHNSKCRYGERGAADAKPKAQIILCVLSSILATQMPCRTPSRSEALRSATAACGGSWRGDPPERCLSRQAGIMRCCLIYYKLLLCQLHYQFGFGGGDGKLEFIL